MSTTLPPRPTINAAAGRPWRPGHRSRPTRRPWPPRCAATWDRSAPVLRPGSVHNTDQCLRSFATYLIGHHPEVASVRDIDRAHVEGYKPWLASRSGRSGAPLAKATTLAPRLGTLRMFFLRIDEWGWEQAPVRVPMFLGDVTKQHHALP